MFWNKKKYDSDNESGDLKEAIKEIDGKSGFLKIYRTEKNGRAKKRRYIDQVALRRIAKVPIEDFLLSEYGGAGNGEYILQLYTKDKGAEKYINEFEFDIAGEPLTEEGEIGEKNDKLSEYALKALEEKIKGGSSLNDILINKLLEKALDGDEQFGKSLKNLQMFSDIVKPNIPIVQPETTEGKFMDLLIGIVPALITAKSAKSLPPEAQQLLTQNPDILRQVSQYNPNLSQMPLPDQITIGNGHKPNKMEAFEILFLEPFKASASQADENNLASMIDAMIVNSLLWLQPDEYPPILKDFILAYESGNLAQLANGFDSLMKFASVPEGKADNIKKILIMSYQSQIKANPDDSAGKAKVTESEGANANE